MNATRLRRVIDAAVTDLGYKAKHCTESVLVREGYFVGRQFRYPGIRAIWFAEEEIVKLLGDNGHSMGAFSLDDGPAVLRSAA